MRKSRPPLFKWRHFEPAVITCAVGWYLRFSLSYRNVEEILTERGLPADHTTIWRWVQCYAPELNKRCRRELKPTNGSWRVDETYIRVKGKWTYLYRARRLGRCYDRFPACRPARCCCRQALLPKRLACSWSPSPQGDQRRRQPVLSQGGVGTEAGGQTGSSVSVSYLSLLEQHRGTGSSSDQTTGQRQPRVPILSRGAGDDPGI